MSFASARDWANSGCGVAKPTRPTNSPAAPSPIACTMASPSLLCFCQRPSSARPSGVDDPSKGRALSLHPAEARKRHMVAKHLQLVGRGHVQEPAPVGGGLGPVH